MWRDSWGCGLSLLINERTRAQAEDLRSYLLEREGLPTFRMREFVRKKSRLCVEHGTMLQIEKLASLAILYCSLPCAGAQQYSIAQHLGRTLGI